MAKASRKAREEIRAPATNALARLRDGSVEDMAAMKADLRTLRDTRQYDLMAKLAEALSRRHPEDAGLRKLYAQCMIETGYCTAAVDVLRATAERLPPADAEWAEVHGLIGRAAKQIVCDAGDKGGADVQSWLRQAIDAYRLPWSHDRANVWHGVNLAALAAFAGRAGSPAAGDLDPEAIAGDVVARLEKTPADKRSEWHAATLAEAYLALGKLKSVEKQVREYTAGAKTNPFMIAGTLRQLTEVWDLENGSDRERSIVAALRARLLELDDHALRIDPREASAISNFAASRKTLESILGDDGPQTYRFMQLGMQRALSVASIWLDRPGYSARLGSGFLVRAGDFACFGRSDIRDDELLVATNWHVVNEHGQPPGIRPEHALVKFEAALPASANRIRQIVWTRDFSLHDVAFLQLEGQPPAVQPLPLARELPAAGPGARVFIIGYPGGRELALSLQDNQLVAHEGPPKGKPVTKGVVRVHYRTPTEPGSSGSPVFDQTGWEVVAIHHGGPPEGVTGPSAANEGISIGSIQAAIRRDIEKAERRGRRRKKHG
jgi:hypothetical protein